MAEQKSIPDEVSLMDVLGYGVIWFAFIKSKWYVLTICLLFGVLFGYIYSKNQPQYYKAEVKFLLEGAKASAPSPLEGISATLGIATTPSVSVGGDISYMMSSPLIIERILISKGTMANKRGYIIDFYTHIRNKNRSLLGTDQIIYSQKFTGIRDSSDIEQNSFFRAVIDDVKSKMKVSTDPSSGLLSVKFEAEDPVFPKVFLEVLLDVTTSYYTYSKTGKILANIKTLKKQTDSIRSVLGGSMASAAYSGDVDPNSTRPNTVRVTYQKKQIDNTILQTTYQTLASSLVASRIELGKETPFIQVYEKPILPLLQNPNPSLAVQIIKFAIVFFVTSGFLLTLVFMFRIIGDAHRNSSSSRVIV